MFFKIIGNVSVKGSWLWVWVNCDCGDEWCFFEGKGYWGILEEFESGCRLYYRGFKRLLGLVGVLWRFFKRSE